MKIPKLLVRLKVLLPNIFTFLSIYFAYQAFISEVLVDRCWLLLLCVLMDKLDGTTARLLKATTRFGLKFDSLADAIAFGLLPGVIIYQGADLIPSGLEGGSFFAILFQLSGVIYILATFIRLYKFDRMAIQDENLSGFFGIPSTLAGAVFAGYCVAFGPYFEAQLGLVFLLPLWGILLSVLMNGNFPTLKVGIPERKSLRILQTLVVIYCFIAIPLKKTALGLFLLSLVVLFITIYYGKKKFRPSQTLLAEEEGVENS